MTTVTLSVASSEDVTRRALAAFEGKAQGAHISFASPSHETRTRSLDLSSSLSGWRSRTMWWWREVSR
jgi:hypothetical protein